MYRYLFENVTRSKLTYYVLAIDTVLGQFALDFMKISTLTTSKGRNSKICPGIILKIGPEVQDNPRNKLAAAVWMVTFF